MKCLQLFLLVIGLSIVVAACSQESSHQDKTEAPTNQTTRESPMSDNNPFAKSQQPWLKAEIHSNFALFSLYINGVRVYVNQTPSAATNITLPVSKYFQDGSNTIKLTMLTPPDKWAQKAKSLGKSSEVSVQLQVGPFSSSSTNYDLNKLSFHTAPDGYTDKAEEIQGSTKQAEWVFDAESDTFTTAKSDQAPLVSVSAPQIQSGKVFNQYQGKGVYQMAEGIAVSQELKLPLPFPEWIWMKADKLTADKSTIRHQLYEVYQRIWQAVENNNVKSLKPLFSEVDKDREIWSFGHIPTGSILKGIQEDANNDNRKLFKMPEEKYNVVIYDEQVACLKIGADRDALVFNFVNGSGASRITLCFGKINGEWKVVL